MVVDFKTDVSFEFLEILSSTKKIKTRIMVAFYLYYFSLFDVQTLGLHLPLSLFYLMQRIWNKLEFLNAHFNSLDITKHMYSCKFNLNSFLSFRIVVEAYFILNFIPFCFTSAQYGQQSMISL